MVSTSFVVRDYDLAGTLESGQVFRWKPGGGGWVGVIGGQWVRLRSEGKAITAETATAVSDWKWLSEYLQLDVKLEEVLASFPDDTPMRAAVAACRGLRLLRQEPWECLASFILSSTKQIVQIRQIIESLCARYGEPLTVLPECRPAWSFPSAQRLADATEDELRACKMGFRAKYLLGVARRLAEGQFELEHLRGESVERARGELMELAGVGRKIADCVLLFAYGFQDAFPVDVWVAKGLRQLYFPRRRVSLRRLHQFSAAHFGPNAGFAQQYLFHYMRRHSRASVRPA